MQGIGFAIAINTARPIADQLASGGRVAHPFLGIGYGLLTPARSPLDVLVKQGMVVGQVAANGPAVRAALRRRDVIVAVDDQPIVDETTLRRALNRYNPGAASSGDTIQAPSKKPSPHPAQDGAKAQTMKEFSTVRPQAAVAPRTTVGSGDAFVAGLAVALARGGELPDGLRLGTLELQPLRLFRIVAFDWDGTAVNSCEEDAAPLRALLGQLLRLEVKIFVLTESNFPNINRQLSAAMHGRAKQYLFVAANCGSEVFGFDQEEHHLTALAESVRDQFAARTGLESRVAYDRLNRRTIDLIALPEWRDPTKSDIAGLARAVEARLRGVSLDGGLPEILELARRAAREQGLPDARITTDVKHVEVGLTDKADSIAWPVREMARSRGIAPAEILLAGDEFGPLTGMPGSDARMLTPEVVGAFAVSVGPVSGTARRADRAARVGAGTLGRGRWGRRGG